MSEDRQQGLWPAIALCVGLLALTLVSAAPDLGWFDLDQQTRAAVGVGRLALGVALMGLLARRAGYSAGRVALVGIPVMIVLTMGWFWFRPPLTQVELSALPPGEGSYVSLCADCHGEMGVGGQGPSLDDANWIRGTGSSAELLTSLGEHDLPFDQMLSAPEQEALVRYLISLQPPEE